MTRRTLGQEIGEGTALFVNNFINRQDQAEAIRRQQEQQAQDNAFRQQQLDEQRRQSEATLAAQAARDAEAKRQFEAAQARLNAVDAYNAGRDQAGDRENILRNSLSPQYNDFQKALQGDLVQYAPKLPDGRPNPGYDQGMLDTTLARGKQAWKLWSSLGLSVGSGENWKETTGQFLAFIGGQMPEGTPGGQALPVGVQPQPLPQSAPPISAPLSATPVPGLSSAPQPSQATPPTAQASAPVGNTPPQQPAAPTAFPANIQQVLLPDLLKLEDAVIRQTYGQGGLDYARAARAQYQQKLDTGRQKALDAQVNFWTKAATNLLEDKDHPPTAEQLAAASAVISYIQNPTKEGEADFRAGIKQLAPQSLNATSWLKVLESKDPNTIYGAYQMYKSQAPDVVKGFPGETYYDLVQQGMDDKAADILLKEANTQKVGADTRKTDADTTRITTLLPLESREYNDKHAESVVGVANTQADTDYKKVQTQGVQATTAKTLQDVAGAKTDQAVKLLGSFATFPPDMSYDQAARANPGLVSQIKSLLGVNDAGLVNLWRQAQYSYGLGLHGKELENQLKGSEILTDGAKRGGIIADTANTQADTGLTNEQAATERATRDGKVRKLDSDIQLAAAQGLNIDSLVTERNTLLPYKTGQLEALTSQAKSGAALNWARIGDIQANIQDRRQRTAGYLQGVKGQLEVDAARVGEITANTAYTRATNPNDPLYNPLLAKANPTKPQNPIDSLVKHANIYYGQADQALKQAGVLQTQLNSLVKQYTGASGSVNLKNLQADPKYTSLVNQRDHLFQVAQNRTATGDKVITDGLPRVNQSFSPKNPTVAPGLTSARQWAAANPEVPGVPSDCAAIQSRYLNSLGLTIPSSNLSAGLENNAKKAGWTSVPLNGGKGLKEGDLLVWTGGRYGYQKDGKGVGKHVASFAGYQNGVPMVLNNPGLQSDGTQGRTEVIPLFDIPNAVAYRSPRSAGLAGGQPTPQPAAARPVAASQSTAFKPNKGLEANLTQAFQTANRDKLDAVIGQMTKAGYSQAQIDAVIERAKK